MALKSVELAIADLAHLDATNKAYTHLQRAMNTLGEQVNSLSEQRRKDVFREIEDGVTDWLLNGMPRLDVPEPEPEPAPAAKRPNNFGESAGSWNVKNGRAAYGTGASVAIAAFLRDHGPAKTREIIAGVEGKFKTHARDWRSAVYAALHTMMHGKYARLTRDADGRYALLPGR